MVLIAKEKAVYNTLNLFSYDPAHQILVAEAWCPTNDLPLVSTTLQDVTNQAGISVPSIINEVRTNKKLPTYVKTNKFTEGFQTIVNAYGTATYQEVNPAMPVIITFPFLFAVMFGDFGHAVIMLSAALAMVYWEKPLKKVTFELFAMIFYGRYIALVMAVFSLFTGLIYNDAFSKSITLFDSAWTFKKPEGWQEKHYKMKMSIILGWAYITYSLYFSYINARHFKKPIDIWAKFLPRIIFFQAIFGYLVLCIIYKWSVDWFDTGAQPPSLLNMLIYMFLRPGTLDERLYAGQEIGETSRSGALDGDDENEPLVDGRGDSFGDDGEGVVMNTQNIGEDQPFEFGEVMMYQVIDTIEFCLNCVSHTASYLRLWALLLAHQQLSVVLWNTTLGRALKMGGIVGIIMIVVSFYVWFFLTIAILVCMEEESEELKDYLG
ncbi:hypothetical protein V2G26_019174 [Clonostachys chloroleuca]